MNIVEEIFDVVGQTIQGFMQAINDAISGVVGVFWNPTTGLSFVGTLMLLGLGIALVYFAISFITGLIRK